MFRKTVDYMLTGVAALLDICESNKVEETQEETEMVLLKSVTSEKVKLRKIKLEDVYIIFK